MKKILYVIGFFVICGIIGAITGGDDKNNNHQTQKVEQTKPVEQKKVLSAAE